MKKIVLLSLLAAPLLTSLTAHASSKTAELKVTGVIKRAACSASFSGSLVKFDNIPFRTLTPGAYTRLPTKKVTLTVNCDGGQKIGIKAVDNRPGSRISGITHGFTETQSDDYNYGLGKAGEVKIGGYALSMTPNTTANGVVVRNIYTRDNRQSWLPARDFRHGDYLFAYGSLEGGPVLSRTLVTEINVNAILNKPEELPAGQDVELDGAVTVEIRYL